MDKSKLLKTAWEIAKQASVKFNDSVKVFFSESLKQAWKNMKKATRTNTLEQLEKELDSLLDECDGGTLLFPKAQILQVDCPALPFGSSLNVNINGTVDFIDQRSVERKEHKSFLDTDIDNDDGSTETLTEPYISETFNYTDAQSIMNLVGKLSHGLASY